MIYEIITEPELKVVIYTKGGSTVIVNKHNLRAVRVNAEGQLVVYSGYVEVHIELKGGLSMRVATCSREFVKALFDIVSMVVD